MCVCVCFDEYKFCTEWLPSLNSRKPLSLASSIPWCQARVWEKDGLKGRRSQVEWSSGGASLQLANCDPIWQSEWFSQSGTAANPIEEKVNNKGELDAGSLSFCWLHQIVVYCSFVEYLLKVIYVPYNLPVCLNHIEVMIMSLLIKVGNNTRRLTTQ